MKQWNIKTPLVFRLGAILLCMLIISSNMIGDLYARYTATAVGSASANVAKFSGGEVRANSDYIIAKDYTGSSIHSGYYKLDVQFEFDIYEADVTKEYTLILTLEPATSVIDVANKEPTFLTPSGSIYDGGNVEAGTMAGNSAQLITCSVPGVTISTFDKEIIISGTLNYGEAINGATLRFSYYLPSEQSKGIESAYIRCELICEQVD